MSSREHYVVVVGDDDVPDPALVCEAVFGVLDPAARSASVDAYSDIADAMPADAVPHDIRAAEQWLRAAGLRRDEGDPGVSVRVSRDDETGWTIARAYAVWSVHIAVYDETGGTIAALHDGGRSVTAYLTPDEATLLAALVSPHYELEVMAAATPPNPEPTAPAPGAERTLERWLSLRS